MFPFLGLTAQFVERYDYGFGRPEFQMHLVPIRFQRILLAVSRIVYPCFPAFAYRRIEFQPGTLPGGETCVCKKEPVGSVIGNVMVLK